MRAISKKPISRVKKFSTGGEFWPPEVKARMLASGNWKEGPNGELIRLTDDEINQAALQESREKAFPEKYTPTKLGFMSDQRREHLENLDRPLTEEEAREYGTEVYNPEQLPNQIFSLASGFGTPYAALEDYLIGRFLQAGKGGLNYLLKEGQARLGPYLEKGVDKGLELYDKIAPKFGAQKLPTKKAYPDNWELGMSQIDVIDRAEALNRLVPLEVQQAILRSDVSPAMQRRWAELGEITANKIAIYANDPVLESIENPEVRRRTQMLISRAYPDRGLGEFIYDNKENLPKEVVDHLYKFENEMLSLSKEADRWREAMGVRGDAVKGASAVGNPPQVHSRAGGARALGQYPDNQLSAQKASDKVYRSTRDDLELDLQDWNNPNKGWTDSDKAMERVSVVSGDEQTAKFDELIGGDMTRRARVQMELHTFGGSEGVSVSELNSKVGKNEWPSAKKDFVVYRNQAPKNVDPDYTTVTVSRNGKKLEVGQTNDYKKGDLIHGLSQSPMGDAAVSGRNAFLGVEDRVYRPTSTSLSSGLNNSSYSPGALGAAYSEGKAVEGAVDVVDRKIKIVVPKGTSAAGAQQYTGRSGYPSEMEVLLHQDQKYVVTNVSPSMVEMRAISDAEYNRLMKQSGSFSAGGRLVKSRKPGVLVIK
jgi:hypothetical protein